MGSQESNLEQDKSEQDVSSLACSELTRILATEYSCHSSDESTSLTDTFQPFRPAPSEPTQPAPAPGLPPGHPDA